MARRARTRELFSLLPRFVIPDASLNRRSLHYKKTTLKSRAACTHGPPVDQTEVEDDTRTARTASSEYLVLALDLVLLHSASSVCSQIVLVLLASVSTLSLVFAIAAPIVLFGD